MEKDVFEAQITAASVRACIVCRHFEMFPKEGYSGVCNYGGWLHFVEIENVCGLFSKRPTPKEWRKTHNCRHGAEYPKTCFNCRHVHEAGVDEDGFEHGECGIAISNHAYITDIDSKSVCDLFEEKVADIV